MVLDADALNIISEGRLVATESAHWVITPHPGEAARLLGMTTAEVQADRFKAVKLLQQKFNCPALLKGAGSLVCSATEVGDIPEVTIGLCDAGNPGMAVGGMGDVLSGIVGALLAQGLSSDIALSLGVCLHAEAGDMASSRGECGVLATDLFEPLFELINTSVGK